jgi:hypothetical protein
LNGPIAFGTIRAMLEAPIARKERVVSLQMTALTREGKWSTDGASIFQSSMIELALLVILILVLVYAITLLGRHAPAPKELMDGLQ